MISAIGYMGAIYPFESQSELIINVVQVQLVQRRNNGHFIFGYIDEAVIVTTEVMCALVRFYQMCKIVEDISHFLELKTAEDRHFILLQELRQY